MAVSFTHHPTEKQAAAALYNELRRYLGEGIEYHADEDSPEIAARTATAPFVVMLAGGSTPMNVYRRLAEEPPRRVHPAATLMLSDDRYVPLDDDRSNYKHIHPLVEQLGLPEERFVHLDAGLPLDGAVTDFGRRIAALSGRDAIFALAVLGIGADGHTASLFSPDLVPDKPAGPAVGTGDLIADGAETCAVATGVHGGVDRVSASAQVLLSFRKVIFFATGESKRDILYELSRRPEQFPAGRILLQHPNAEIWTAEAPRVV